MKLDRDEALRRLAAYDHGVLSTINATGGVDSVPVVYALDPDGYLGIPIDTVKPKSSTELQRERNTTADPRATLLVDHWDRHDWSKLWWVRVRLLRSDNETVSERLADALAGKYPYYSAKPFARILVFEIDVVSGWSAS